MTLNSRAEKIAFEMEMRSDEIEIEVHKLDNGTRVLDCGVREKGSFEAGLLFSHICLGGKGDLRFSDSEYGSQKLKNINLEIDMPELPCIGSQKAGWNVKVGDFFAMGSGPARMLLPSAPAKYKEDSDKGVLALECSILPDERVAEHIAKKTDVKEENLTLLAAKTASIVGSTQVSARMVETALFKMDHLGMKLEAVKHALGVAPIAPVIGDDNKMMGVSNDMVIYGASITLDVEGDLDLDAIPSNSSKEYGVPFKEIFKRAEYDFYKIDHGIFAPAKVTAKNLQTGETKKAGSINYEVLEQTLNP